MPPKIKMTLDNGNRMPVAKQNNATNMSNVAVAPQIPQQKSNSSLKAPIISRIHNAKPGCGSCGKH